MKLKIPAVSNPGNLLPQVNTRDWVIRASERKIQMGSALHDKHGHKDEG
jgi:hypothetical protein